MAQGQGRWVYAWLLCASAIGGASAQAQTLSHDEAVRMAIERAPTVVAQRSALEAARAGVEFAGRLPDPELLLGLDNVPIEGADAYSLTNESMTMRRVGVMQAVPNSAKRAAARERARAQVGRADAALTQMQLDAARATSSAWFAVASARELIEQLQSLIAQARLQARVQQAALASAQSSTLEALNAGSAVAQLKDRLLDAQRSERTAHAELERWIGANNATLGTAPSIHELPVARNTLLNSLHRHALVRALDQQIAAAQSELDAAKADKRPDMSFELAYAKRGSEFSDMISLEFRMGLPLFAAHRQDPTIRAAQAGVSELQAMRESELKMHAAETAAQLAAWDAAHERLLLLEQERLPLAQQATQAAQAAYRAGSGTLATLLDTRMREAELLAERAEVKQQLAQAWAFLRYLEPEETSP
jgi:outer membrane protein TolC